MTLICVHFCFLPGGCGVSWFACFAILLFIGLIVFCLVCLIYMCVILGVGWVFSDFGYVRRLILFVYGVGKLVVLGDCGGFCIRIKLVLVAVVFVLGCFGCRDLCLNVVVGIV